MLEALVVAETVAIGLLGVLVAGLLRSHGEVLRILHRIGAGSQWSDGPGATDVTIEPRRRDRAVVAEAVTVQGVTLDDQAVAWPMRAGRDTLLAFLSGGCETCQPFWAALRDGVDVPGGADVLVVTGGPERESESLLRRLAPPDQALVMSSAAWDAYEVPGSPHFVYVDGQSGRVLGEGTAPSWPQVVSLLERAVGDRTLSRRRAVAPDRDAPHRVDAELAAAGITAGHPSLYSHPHGLTAPDDASEGA